MAYDTSANAVTAWLKGAGYPLEYETARILRAASFTVHQGRAYLDRAENKTREIDVVAALRSSDSYVDVRLMVECKRTEKTAWVVLTNDSPLGPEDVLEATLATTTARTLLVEAAKTVKRGIPEFLTIATRHGFSVVQAHRDPNDDRPEQPFKAMSQVVSAAVSPFSERAWGMWLLVWPVVVIDGPLYEVTATQTGDEIAAVDEARVLWHGGPAFRPVIVDVVRKPALEAYAARAYGGLRSVQTLLENAAVAARKETGSGEYG